MDRPVLESLDHALLLLQSDPPVLTKSKAGQVGNQKTKYADLVEVNKVVLAALNQLGVIWKCLPTMAGERFVLRYTLTHVPSGEYQTGDYPLNLSEPQKMGSAITYARRYALLAVTGIAAEDEDDDGDAASGRNYAQRAASRPREQAPPANGRTAQRATQRPRGARPALPGEDPDGPVGPDQHKHMYALWNELGCGGDENRERRLAITASILGLESLDTSASLTRAQGDVVIGRLRDRKAAMESQGATS
jgi:ERF superfamily